MSDIKKLIKRQDGDRSNDLDLDVLVELALFSPDDKHVSIRANDAGTKVIYTDKSGDDETFWPQDWHKSPVSTIAMLKAKAST